MPKKWDKLTDKFDAQSEDGRQFKILVYTQMLEQGTVEGLKGYKTSEGYHCSWIDDDTWEILELDDLKVKRVI